MKVLTWLVTCCLYISQDRYVVISLSDIILVGVVTPPNKQSTAVERLLDLSKHVLNSASIFL